MRLFKGIIGLVFIFLAIIFVYDIRFAIIFVSSYIFHELWHLILIKSFHFKVEEIHLIPFGGQIKMNCKKNHSPLIDAFIYLAGPLGNAILLVLSFIIKSDNLKMINLILFLFNLMPIMPLDGFYILVNFLALKLPYFYALKICLIISIVFASALLILAPFINYCFLILAGYMLFISITAALIEEFGRYIAFHFVTRDCTVNNIPLYYGFGHGGIEALSVGINNIFLILFSSDYLASTGASVALAGVERISTQIAQIAFSFIVFYAFHKKKYRYLMLAIVLHTVYDFSVILLNYGLSPSVLEMLLFVVSIVLLLFTMKYKKGVFQNEENC